MGRFFAINLAVLMGLGLLSMSSAQAQNAYGGVASDTRGEVSIRAPKPSVAKRYAAKIRANYLRHAAKIRANYLRLTVDRKGNPIIRRASWRHMNPGINAGQLTYSSKNMPSFDDKYQRHLGVLDTLRR
jgi:hypothetical protein